ncbi:MAG TPA: NADH-quinone oxidoreductase subunit NuoE [Dissulfurispiraceae bacterium]|nr:NADH-quinone oxidoreductase subunit NuoE [Dissulfurispiraceae bacterium]
MLTVEERRDIEEEIRKAPTMKAAVIDVLKTVQKHRGWVPDEALEEAAALLGMTAAEVDSIATFFSLIYRKPVGRHVILICDGVSCWLVGYEDVKQRLMERLGIAPGETTGDGKFTLLPSACLGVCEEAPAMMIDDRLYTKLTPDSVDEILAGYRDDN